MLDWNLHPKTLSSAKILIVDGDEAALRLIEESLQREGYTCARATTGNAALIALSEHPPDLMLVDLNLPDISGQELIDRQEKGGTAVPFIIITARVGERVAVEIMKRGALDYLVKDAQPLVSPAVGRSARLTRDRAAEVARRSRGEAGSAYKPAAGQAPAIRRLLASVPGVLWETSSGPTTANQRIVFVSDYVEKLLGYTVQQWLSKTNFLADHRASRRQETGSPAGGPRFSPVAKAESSDRV